MFFYERNNKKLSFEINGIDYEIENKHLMKYNYNKRNADNIAEKEFIEKEEIEQLVIELVNILYKQNKILAENIIRGV